MITTITLDNLQFLGYHGYYDEEQSLGNKYSITLSVQVDCTLDALLSDKLEGTVSYEDLYKLVAKKMSIPSRLLERLACQILDSCLQQHPQILSANVQISKHNPPIGGLCDKATVTLSMDRDNLKD